MSLLLAVLFVMFYLFLLQHNFWWRRMNEQIIWNVNVEHYRHIKRIEFFGRVEHKGVAGWSKCRTMMELDKKIWGSLGGVLPNMMWKVLAFPKMMHRFRSNTYTHTHTNQCNVNFTCERISHSHKFLPLSVRKLEKWPVCIKKTITFQLNKLFNWFF